jgi:predicted negative regulator of RcsB-dependent stress response
MGKNKKWLRISGIIVLSIVVITAIVVSIGYCNWNDEFSESERELDLHLKQIHQDN